MPWWGRTDGRKNKVCLGKLQYRIALSCAEHSVSTSLGEIKQPYPRLLSGRGLTPNFFSSSAFLCGKISQVQRSDFCDSAKVKQLRQIGAEMVSDSKATT